MKLAILGAGGFRTPWLYEMVLRSPDHAGFDRIALYDTDIDRLYTIESVLADQRKRLDTGGPEVSSTTDLAEALDGADFVFSAIRVGGLAGRIRDERIALSLGVIGQETVGPGGLSYGLRTVPVVDQLADAIAEHAPGAYVINFTNPAGLITEAMQTRLGDKVIGVCDTPSGLVHRVSRLLAVDPPVTIDYCGLNHLGWLRGLRAEGSDENLVERLFDDPGRLHKLDEAGIFGTEWLRGLGSIPNEYLYYYYCNREAVSTIRNAGETRGEFLKRTQHDFYTGMASGHNPYQRWRMFADARDAAYMAEAHADRPREQPDSDDPAERGYAGVALACVRALTGAEPATVIVNVANRGTIPQLDDDAVIETVCRLSGDGIERLPVSPPRLGELGLMSAIKSAERYVIAAVRERRREYAVLAMAAHPLVNSIAIGNRLVTQYTVAYPHLATLLD